MISRKDRVATFKSTRTFLRVGIARFPFAGHPKVSKWRRTCSVKLSKLVQTIPTQEVAAVATNHMEDTNRVATSNKEATISNSSTAAISNSREVIISNSSTANHKEVMDKIPDTEALPKPSNISSKANTSRGHLKEDTELLHRPPHKHPSGNPQPHPMVKHTIITKLRGRQRGKNLRECHREWEVVKKKRCMNSPSIVFDEDVFFV